MIQTKYAIVVVTYNREILLQECIDKAANQTIKPDCIIIVNNASTDKTKIYLNKIDDGSGFFDIINLSQNIGGAGGFAKGIEHAIKKDVECILIIDDDAMIEKDYMERILQERQRRFEYKAFAGTVKVNDKIDTFHRRKVSDIGMLLRNCKEEEYLRVCFECDIASFCGMVLDVELIKRIGLPHSRYFIWHDDAEYSLRIRKYSKFLVVTRAVLAHKTKINEIVRPRRYDWREYYAIRNRILLVKEHGTILDRIINTMHLFVHVIFRNWVFKLIKVDHYDWKYENAIVKEAIRDAKGNEKYVENRTCRVRR